MDKAGKSRGDMLAVGKQEQGQVHQSSGKYEAEKAIVSLSQIF
jgi:hypothetical protein